jgi:hypothetical protein
MVLVGVLVGEREIVDRDAVRQGAVGRAALRDRGAVVEPEQHVLLRVEPEVGERLHVRLVLDHELEIDDARAQRLRDRRHRLGDELAEALARDARLPVATRRPGRGRVRRHGEKGSTGVNFSSLGSILPR